MYTMLTRYNYAEWAMLMEVMLQARGYWEVVNLGGDDNTDEMMAKEAILRAVPLEMWCPLAKKTAKLAWNAIEMMCVGFDCAQQLKEYEMISFRDGESVDDFALHLSRIVHQLEVLGDLVNDDKVVAMYLHMVPPKFAQIALYISTPSMEEVTGWLRVAEDL
jgi:hypothetical protein